MQYTTYNMLWLFLIYSFLGWLMETVLAAVKKGKLINRGFLNAPFSPIYGFGWVLFAIFLPDLRSEPFFLFLGGAIAATGLELLTGVLLERITGQKWWDYSNTPLQFEGHISLVYSMIWGLCALACEFFSDSLFIGLVALIPQNVGNIILIAVYTVLGLDFAATLAAVLQYQSSWKLPEETADRLGRFTARLDRAIARFIQRRISRAYPNLEKGHVSERTTEAPNQMRFAQGLCFFKLVWIFVIAAFLGDVVETIFCYVRAGVWMSRSSLVFGPFSVVWGLGAVLLTVILTKYQDRSDGFVFALGTILGGAYEYACSVLTELVFGTVFWDYSHIPFNLGGRINLLYCFFWGIAAVVWLKYIYPRLSCLIELIPRRYGKVITWIVILFMVFNMAISALALGRYTQRQTEQTPAATGLGQVLDDWFPDERIEKVYPNLILVDAQDENGYSLKSHQHTKGVKR